MTGQRHYSVVLIGSSGGGTATLGHTNPVELLRTVHQQLLHIRSEDKVCLGLTHAIFVSLSDGSGFDSLKKEEWLPGNNNAGPMAKLYSVGFHHNNSENPEEIVTSGQNLQVSKSTGTISEINQEAKRLDAKLAKILRKNSAIIALSSEPTVIHVDSLSAAAKLSIPVTCSGGTSSSQIAALYDLPVIGAQGSVASTTLTKARGWARGLAREWGMTYDPSNYVEGSIDGVATEGEGGGGSGKEQTPLPTLKSILEAALPSFLFVCIILRFFGSASKRSNNPLMTAEIVYALRYIVPGTTCSILAASSRHSSSSADQSSCQDQSTILMSSALAGILASASASQHLGTHEGGSALAGLIAGASIPKALSLVSKLCIKYHITATMTNIICGGGVGMMVGMIMHFSSAAYLLSICTGWIRCLIRWKRITIPETNVPITTVSSALVQLQNKWASFALTPSISKFVYVQEVESSELLPIPKLLGFAYGCIFVYGSKIGWYHSIFLPLIILEMDSSTGENAASMFGAIDECTLVMVCAGVCAGNLITRSGNSSLSWQALKTNILCGDFIEACYPFMERSRVINTAAYLAAGISTEIIVCQRLLSSAYFPLPLSILISNDRFGMSVASSVAFGISLIGTLVSNKLDAIRKRKGD